MENVHVISMDFDGCGENLSVRLFAYEMMYDILSRDPDAIIVILVGSARQTIFRNLWTMNYNKNENCFRVLHQFANLEPAKNEAEIPAYTAIRERLFPFRERIRMCGLLMEDIIEEKPPGTHFSMALALPEQDEWKQGEYKTTRFNAANSPMFDETKMVLVSSQIRHILALYPHANTVSMNFLDDKLDILDRVFNHTKLKQPSLPSKFKLQLFNGTFHGVSPFLSTIVGTSPDASPLQPCNKEDTYALAFEIFTGQTDLVKILNVLIEHDSKLKLPQGRHPFALISYVTLLLKTPARWTELCLLLEGSKAWPRILPDVMYQAAKEQKNFPAMLLLLSRGERYFLHRPQSEEIHKDLTPVFEQAVRQHNLRDIAILYPYLKDPSAELIQHLPSAILGQMTHQLLALESKKRARALCRTMPFKERVARFTPPWIKLMLDNQPDKCLDLLQPYFSISPQMQANIRNLVHWRTSSSFAEALTEVLYNKPYIQTHTLTLLSSFLRTIQDIPEAFHTSDGQTAWRVLVNIDPFCLENHQDDQDFIYDEGILLYLTFALKYLGTRFPLQTNGQVSEHHAYLSFRLFTTGELKTDEIHREAYAHFLSCVRGLTVPEVDVSTLLFEKTGLERKVSLFFENRLKGKTLTQELRASLTQLERMLARAQPTTKESFQALIQKWRLKVPEDSKTNEEIWEQWTIKNNNCCVLFFSKPIDILTGLKNCWDDEPMPDRKRRRTAPSLPLATEATPLCPTL